MKVLLRQNHDQLGEAGKIVSVKDGYARNYLIPQGVAYQATTRNTKIFEQELKRGEALKIKQKKVADNLKEKLNGVSVTAPMQVGEEDRIFGSVTSQDIADLLTAKGFNINKRKIVLEEPVRTLGIYDIPIKLHSEIECTIKLWVVKQ